MMYVEKGFQILKYAKIRVFSDPYSDIFLRIEASTGGVLRNFPKFTGKHLCQSPFQYSSRPEPGRLLLYAVYIKKVFHDSNACLEDDVNVTDQTSNMLHKK